jgi:hypothetical protein
MKVWIIETRERAGSFIFFGVAESDTAAMKVVDSLQQNLVGWTWIDGIKVWEKRLAPFTYQISEHEVRT